MNLTLRMYTDKHHLPLERVATTVSVNRATEGVARFEYQVDLIGNLDAAQKARLLEVASKCPVRKTISRTIEFGNLEDAGGAN